jgi:hypothetical protein
MTRPFGVPPSCGLPCGPGSTSAGDLRVLPELHARLTALVEREHRSLTAQTLYLLEQWAEEREQEERRRQQQGQGPADSPTTR